MSRFVALFVLVVLALVASTQAASRRHRLYSLSTVGDGDGGDADAAADAPADAPAGDGAGEEVAALPDAGNAEVRLESQSAILAAQQAANADCNAECEARKAQAKVEAARLQQTEALAQGFEHRANEYKAQYIALKKLIEHAEDIAAQIPAKKQRLEQLSALAGNSAKQATMKEAEVAEGGKEAQMKKLEEEIVQLETQLDEKKAEKQRLVDEISKLKGVEATGSTDDAAAAGGDDAAAAGDDAAAGGDDAASGDGAAPKFRQKFDDNFMF